VTWGSVVFTLPMPDPFHGEKFDRQLAGIGLEHRIWSADMDGNLVFDLDDDQRAGIEALLAEHDGTPTATPLPTGP
jgi:hypothetical protein